MTEQEAIKILNPDADVVWKAYDGKDIERYTKKDRHIIVKNVDRL